MVFFDILLWVYLIGSIAALLEAVRLIYVDIFIYKLFYSKSTLLAVFPVLIISLMGSWFTIYYLQDFKDS